MVSARREKKLVKGFDCLDLAAVLAWKSSPDKVTSGQSQSRKGRVPGSLGRQLRAPGESKPVCSGITEEHGGEEPGVVVVVGIRAPRGVTAPFLPGPGKHTEVSTD